MGSRWSSSIDPTISVSMCEMSAMETELPSHPYNPYDNLVDLELSNIMTRASFSHQNLHTPTPTASTSHIYHGQGHPDVHPLLKLETGNGVSYEPMHPSSAQVLPTHSQLQLSDFDLGPSWTPPLYPYPQLFHNGNRHVTDASGMYYPSHTTGAFSLPQATYRYFEEGDAQSPWSSSPEYPHCQPLNAVEDEEEKTDEKPYARLIYEALMQAPGHRMMLRDIYEWFRHNTTKPQESGTNGWQNSIRHNLSMNKVREGSPSTRG